MQIVTTADAARALARTLPRPVGFVPTMGALHDGHKSLLARAAAENASLVGSLFVNPLQFSVGEDFARYPRAFESDAATFASFETALLYAPSAEQMYPQGFATTLDVGELGRGFEGAQRPGHFNGVATVVLKLLNALEPTTVYLGQKDAQQIAVLSRVVRDLDVAVNVVACATVRETDGLALSSRNVYLNREQRAAAPTLFRALNFVADAILGGAADIRRTAGAAKLERAKAEARRLLGAPLEWDYLDVVDPQSFEPVSSLRPPALVIGAARAGTTRLIDNIPVETY